MPRSSRLDAQISFALYGAASRMIRLHKPLLDPLGLTFPQYLVVLELLDRAPVAVGMLGTRLCMDTGTITPLLKRLDAAGIVTRERDVKDERRVLVGLTARGRGLESEVRGITEKIKTACQMSEKQLVDLHRTLDPANETSHSTKESKS
jgi:MarR family transcriptional regulator, organic hydroperoxide resistance regulator